MIATFANAMMSAQADQVCGAEYGERSAERTNRRQLVRGKCSDHVRQKQAEELRPPLGHQVGGRDSEELDRGGVG